MNILTIVGARPQFVKAASVSCALRDRGIIESLVHTGQHYDFEMSELFFKQLDIPPPVRFLGLGGTTHGKMTGEMLIAIEDLLLTSRPDALLVYGDTNSTLAGALAAVKLHVPVIHVEAGLRSWNKRMPEEINRIMADHVSDLLFCSSAEGVANLAREGISNGVYNCGDVMADVAFRVRQMLKNETFAKDVSATLPVLPHRFALMTLHRAENTDSAPRMSAIIEGIESSGVQVIFPIHPRTEKMLNRYGLTLPPNVQTIPPVGYFEICLLLEKCRIVLTDSGGLQKEAYWLRRPCLTLRDETEWVETLANGWNSLVGADVHMIQRNLQHPPTPGHHLMLYGDGASSVQIANTIAQYFNKNSL